MPALLLGPTVAQAPAPGGSAPGSYWLSEGARHLDREDPARAWVAFQLAAAAGSEDPQCLVGLGRSHLMLGRSAFANRYAEAALAADPTDQDGMTLCIRSMIRARAFDGAVRGAVRFQLDVEEPGSELLAACGSALFRVQRIDAAADLYRRVVGLDPLHPEAHLRLGSGLLPPVRVAISHSLRSAVDAARAGRHRRAVTLLLGVVAEEPGNPIAHRLLGEVLFAQRQAHSMATTDPAFIALAEALPVIDV
ncbi:MAG: tetratricopeptide repeat protein, partial [Planctomycetes bacterium]|nr:tetratricopeptide repeat protein [Planctomycetota bacterium]